MLVRTQSRWVFGLSYSPNLMVNERTYHQHVILCQNLKRSVSVGVCEELKYHKDTLQISLQISKSHDCHVLMQDLIPVAIRGILPKSVRQVITRLCLFFNAICRKVIDPTTLDELENEAIIILCQLEMYFPPSCFDIMVHLIVHLVREIRICGPVFLRWMYPIERCMKF